MDIMGIIVPIAGSIVFAIVAPIVGCLLAGIDRVLSARMQGRVGPPLLQPYYDVRKLLEKEAFDFVGGSFDEVVCGSLDDGLGLFGGQHALASQVSLDGLSEELHAAGLKQLELWPECRQLLDELGERIGLGVLIFVQLGEKGHEPLQVRVSGLKLICLMLRHPCSLSRA